MEIKEIQNKKTWEEFLLECDEKTFLQSWNWGEFQKMMGNKIWRLGLFDGGELFSVALVVKVAARRGTFLLVPHGPVVMKHETYNMKQTLETLLKYLKDIAIEEGTSFIRIAPIWERNKENNQIFKDLGFKLAPIHVHPEASWKLDIRPQEEELLMNMRKTTRYLIRQAQKNNDIEVFQSQNPEDIKKFDKLYQEVVDRHHFVPFSLEYLKNEFMVFQPDNQISLFCGKYKREIVASAFALFWSGIGFYHHAALSPKYHKIPVAYLLQWEAIKEAKKRGCALYDFWGYVDPKENLHPPKFCFAKFRRARHPWAGPTLFKIGFGGEKKEYVKTQDLPLSWKYWPTYIFEKLRRTKRNL